MKLTREEATQVLNDRGTRRLVHQVLQLAENKDPVDAYYDLKLAAAVFYHHMVDAGARTP